MDDEVRIELNQDDINKLKQTYGEEIFNKVLVITQTYNQKITTEAKEIIKQEQKIDTGRLRNSIKSSAKVYANKVVGEVYSGTKYARFVHEGAKHQGNELVSHFVSFGKVPSLLIWAKRHKLIEIINGSYYFIDKNNQEHPIDDINESGLNVYSKAIKFLEEPFNKYKPMYINDLENLIRNLVNN